MNAGLRERSGETVSDREQVGTERKTSTSFNPSFYQFFQSFFHLPFLILPLSTSFDPSFIYLF